ncbi:MAG: metallophosphoesterase [Chloroflexaceae bacterium]|nr:metallophosphoesterase [Chloroflexaceae bacterium]
MRIVLFSDIHGNATALEAVLNDIRRHAAPDLTIVAGDLVEQGPRPAEALALLRSLPNTRFVMATPTAMYCTSKMTAASLPAPSLAPQTWNGWMCCPSRRKWKRHRGTRCWWCMPTRAICIARSSPTPTRCCCARSSKGSPSRLSPSGIITCRLYVPSMTIPW